VVFVVDTNKSKLSLFLYLQFISDSLPASSFFVWLQTKLESIEIYKLVICSTGSLQKITLLSMSGVGIVVKGNPNNTKQHSSHLLKKKNVIHRWLLLQRIQYWETQRLLCWELVRMNNCIDMNGQRRCAIPIQVELIFSHSLQVRLRLSSSSIILITLLQMINQHNVLSLQWSKLHLCLKDRFVAIRQLLLKEETLSSSAQWTEEGRYSLQRKYHITLWFLIISKE